jgi:hypothetical protein
MKNERTIKFQGQIYEYEIDEKNIVYIKDGTTLISIGQMRALKPTENIETIVREMIRLFLPIKPR